MNSTELDAAIQRGFEKAEKRKTDGLSDKERAEQELLKSVTGGLSPKDWTITQPEPVDQN